VIGSIVFAENPIRPFVDHVCRDSLLSSGFAAGSGRFSSNLFEIDTCDVCGMGFTHPLPTEETVHLLYETRESRDFQPDDSSLMTWLKAIVARRDVRAFFGEFERPQGLVLDYACGNATFTIALQEAFPNLQVIGTDMQKESPNALPQSQYRSYVELAEMSGKCSIRSVQNFLGCKYNLGIFVLGMLLHAVQIRIGLATDASGCLRIWGRKTVG
jgi:hypothetical protein